MAKWFMIENCLDKGKQLGENHVVFTAVTIQDPKEVSGIAFPEDEKDRVIELLGLGGIPLVETRTNHEDIFLLERRTHQVLLRSNSNMEAWESIQPVIKEFAIALETDIVVSNPHGKSIQPGTGDGPLEIRFYSTPTMTPDCKKTYKRAFNIELADGQMDGLKPTGKGIQISDADGLVVAELHNRTLYVLFDLPHAHRADGIMRAILREFALLKISPEEREIAKKEALERQLEMYRREYVRECMKRIDFQQKEISKAIDANEKALNEVSQNIVAYTRALEEYYEKRRHLESVGKEKEDLFRSEYDKLLQLPKVQKVRVEDGCVSVYTTTIFFEYKNRTYELGDYRIDIYSNGTLHIENERVRELTNQTRFEHPHVFNDGGQNVCLGNIRDGVFQLIGRYEYAVAAQILIDFLHTVNERDHGGQYIGYLTKNWKPLSEKDKQRRQRREHGNKNPV